MKENVKDLKLEVRRNNKEIKYTKVEIVKMKNEQDEMKKRKTLSKKVRNFEERIEGAERNRIRNNLVITGLRIDTNDEMTLEENVENMDIQG